MNNFKEEDGYILVVIIGILTIFSLMTITFASLSRIETRATRNYADSIKCEMVAKAALEHAIYIIRKDKFGDDDIAYNNDTSDSNYDYNVSSGDASWPGDGVFNGSDYDNDGDSTNESRWIYFPATTSTLDIRLPGKLRARYAVLIAEDREARVNINVTGNRTNGVAHSSNEGWSTFEIDLSHTIEKVSNINSGLADNIASNIIDARYGTDTKAGNSAPLNDNSGIVPNPQTDNLDNDGDWIEANDTNNNGIPDSGEKNVDEDDYSESIDEPSEFNPIFPYGDDVPFGLLTEAEIIGPSLYESRLEEILGKNTVSPSDQLSLNNCITTYSADTIVCPPYILDGIITTTMLNINALASNEGVYDDDKVYYNSYKKVQMIEEVLTAGSVPNIERQQMAVSILDFIDSDDIVTSYDNGTNTFYGVERTPYINEVEAWPSGSNAKFIELFNPYDTAVPNTGNWSIILDAGTTIITLPDLTIPAGSYYVIADKAGTGVNQVDANVGNLDSSGEEIILRDSSGIDVQVTNYGNANKENTCSLNDPRPPWYWTKNTLNTIGAQNSNFDPSAGEDGWENTTPTWPKSFFIANRRFTNKGYIGFIHSGRQWSSFNVGDSIDYPDVLQYFTVIDPSMDNIDNDGDGSKDAADTGSQSGDFDGKEYRIPGLINVNNAPADVLQSLPNIDHIIAIAIESSGSKPFTSIGDMVDKVTEITNTAGTSWDKERTFRSISNLITTRSNVFTVYVTAQITDEEETDVYSEKRILAIIDRSVDPINVRYFRWLLE
ncbi:MAG: lamin tail domain-containing protein [Planctomycetota bacterium]|jgi:type II secretory pathway component PulK